MNQHFSTAYEISAGKDDSTAKFAASILLGTRIGFAVLAVVLCGLACLLYLGRRRYSWKQLRWPTSAALAVSTVGGLPFFMLLMFSHIVRGVEDGESRALEVYRSGAYQVVQGTVTNFDPMPFEGHRPECLSVQEKRFCYSDYEIAPGFHKSASHGGPIRAGLPVRIAYITAGRHNTILKLEISQD